MILFYVIKYRNLDQDLWPIRPSKKTTFFSKNYSSDQNLALNTNNEEN